MVIIRDNAHRFSPRKRKEKEKNREIKRKEEEKDGTKGERKSVIGGE